MDSPVHSTASGIAQAIRRGTVSAAEVLETHLAHIVRHNPALNAIVTLDADQARARALAADRALGRGEVWGPLHGVPITVKDSWETAALRTTSGYPPLGEHVPERDATVVARLRAAGAVLLGKTNTPPLDWDLQTDNPLFGRTSNPWDLNRTPGGSTGGGAAAVAAGLSPLDLGSDIGGSVRVPAHFCGVYGLKPTDHLIPLTGHVPPLPSFGGVVRHMGVPGVLARSLDDLVLALPLLAGPDGGHWDVPPVRLEGGPVRTLRDIRLAWTDDLGSLPVTQGTRTAIARLADDLARQGCHVERAVPVDFDAVTAWETWGELFQAELGSTLSAEDEREIARSANLRLESRMPITRGMARAVDAGVRLYAQILLKRDALGRALDRFLDNRDALLCPVAVGPAFPHCPMGTRIDVDGHAVPYFLAGVGYTCPFNLTGHPAVAVPLTRSPDGLPIGVQVVGRRWRDLELLAVAQLVSRLIPSPKTPPGY